jgi:hypothetical protein
VQNVLPKYDLEKIRYRTDAPTYKRALALYQSGKVTQFSVGPTTYYALVLGSKAYNVVVSAIRYDEGNCDCYLGKSDILCKHMVAVAIQAVQQGNTLEDKDTKEVNPASSSGTKGQLNQSELTALRQKITTAMKCIKGYSGPSRTWFAYQDSLTEGANRLRDIVSSLPVSLESTNVLVHLLLRLDKKLMDGGVDDSDGTIGTLIEEIVEVVKQYIKLDPACGIACKKLINKETVFGWEEELGLLAKDIKKQ